MGPRKKVSRPLTPLVLSNDQLGELSEWEEQLLAKLRLVKDVQVHETLCICARYAARLCCGHRAMSPPCHPLQLACAADAVVPLVLSRFCCQLTQVCAPPRSPAKRRASAPTLAPSHRGDRVPSISNSSNSGRGRWRQRRCSSSRRGP
jgi:hypothetical protein